nr:ASNSD1 upstream ORF protein-like isoform X1 [Biomphalaria glabrata]
MNNENNPNYLDLNLDLELRLKYLESKISIQNVIQSELQQLKKSSKVYHKQRNSDIFFLSTVDQELSVSQVDLKKLTTELEELKHGLNRN